MAKVPEICLYVSKVWALVPLRLETTEDLTHFFPPVLLFQHFGEPLRLEATRNMRAQFSEQFLEAVRYILVVGNKLANLLVGRLTNRHRRRRGIAKPAPYFINWLIRRPRLLHDQGWLITTQSSKVYGRDWLTGSLPSLQLLPLVWDRR